LQSTSTPSGQPAREAAEYIYSAQADSVKNEDLKQIYQQSV
jgi:hypothetical protein